MKPPAFLLYDNRSGSTYLSVLLNRYRGVAVSVETDVVFQVLEYPGRLRTGADIGRFVDVLFRKTRFPELNIERNAVERAIAARPVPDDAFAQKAFLLNGLLDLYFRRTDPEAESRVVKGPRLHFHMEALLRACPGAKFIQIIRDGRAVFNSKKRTPSVQKMKHGSGKPRPMDRNLIHAAREWRKKLDIAARFESRVLNVRYEDLILSRAEVVDRILDYLDVSKENRVETKARDDLIDRMASGYRAIHPHASSPAQSRHVDKWKTDLGPERIDLYEKINRSHLERYGYETGKAAGKQKGAFRFKVFLLHAGYRLDMLRRAVRHPLLAVFVTRDLAGRIRRKIHEIRARRNAAGCGRRELR